MVVSVSAARSLSQRVALMVVMVVVVATFL